MVRFSEDDVRRLLPMKDAISRLREAFTDYSQGLAQNQPRRRLTLSTGAMLHSLVGAWGNYFGTKVYSTHPKHGAHFTFLLYDAETAQPLAQFEANWLGQIRTGAATGLAVDLLTPRDRPVSVGCIGTGFQAQGQLDAIAAVRTISSLRTWSRHSATGSAAEVAEGADILITATGAKEPVIEASAVRPGSLVVAMGSNHPKRRELPEELVRDSFVVVDDKEACQIEAGDLLLAFDEQGWDATVELRHLVADPALASTREGRTAVFKSVGLGLEDVAVAAWVYSCAGI